MNGSGITYQVNGKQYVAVYTQAPRWGHRCTRAILQITLPRDTARS